MTGIGMAMNTTRRVLTAGVWLMGVLVAKSVRSVGDEEAEIVPESDEAIVNHETEGEMVAVQVITSELRVVTCTTPEASSCIS